MLFCFFDSCGRNNLRSRSRSLSHTSGRKSFSHLGWRSLRLEPLEQRRLLATIHVDLGATGANTGEDWGNAYTDLQSALSAAVSSDEIWVAEGTYTPTSGGDRTLSFTLKSGVDVYGGFDASESTREERDWTSHVTALSGDLNGDDTTGGDNSENSYHVVFADGVTEATLDGFTITAGNADYPSEEDFSNYGGGMCNLYSSSPTLTNITFSGNSAEFGGGMLNGFSSSPTLTNVTFSGNSADYCGGMYNGFSSSPTLTNCTFSDNSADLEGGGMGNYMSSPTLINVTFDGNSASNAGGMLNAWSTSSPTLVDCTFSGNTASEDGGGMYNAQSSSATLTNCTFSFNSAEWVGGSMYNSSSSATLTNCTISHNSADYGGGMWNDSSSPTLTNCTFLNNVGNYLGGGVYNAYSSSPTVTNCTFTDNYSQAGGGMLNVYLSSPTLTNCTFIRNSADAFGGGMANSSTWESFPSSPTVTNCTFSGNSAVYGGGMSNEESSSPTVTNCTFTGNSAEGYGGGMLNYAFSSTTVTNSILWENTAAIFGPEIWDVAGSTTTVTYSNVLGGWTGDGNVDVDPLFVRQPSRGPDGTWGTPDDDYGDLRLQAGSPAIDAGDNAEVSLDGADLDGDGVTTEPTPLDLDMLPRFVDISSVTDTGNGPPPIVDMGAYEHQNPNEAPVITGQGPLSTPEESSLTVTLADLTVTDPDNTYPDDFTLSVADGVNYTRSGNTITPLADFNGTLTVPVTVNDGMADSAVYNLSVDVTPVNDAPVADGQSITTNEDTPTAITLTATDRDEDELTFSIASYPSHGTLTDFDPETGTVVYNPDPDYDGDDSFTFRANDGTADSNEATVSITVLSAEKQTEAIIDEVFQWVDEGFLGSGEGNGLVSKLDTAIASLDKGKLTSAVNKLEAFENQIQALVRSGRVSPEEAEALIALAEAAIHSILTGSEDATDAAFSDLEGDAAAIPLDSPLLADFATVGSSKPEKGQK